MSTNSFSSASSYTHSTSSRLLLLCWYRDLIAFAAAALVSGVQVRAVIGFGAGGLGLAIGETLTRLLASGVLLAPERSQQP